MDHRAPAEHRAIRGSPSPSSPAREPEHGAQVSGPAVHGREGSLIQSLHEPEYSRAMGSPAWVMASRSWQAVTPEPQ